MQIDLASQRQRCEQHLQILSDISMALGKKDPYTQAHGYRVALYAMRFAERLGFSAQETRNIGIGGLLHDVGKLALSDQIFTNCEEHLPSDLRQEVNCHPLIGATLLKDIDFLQPVLDIVLFHHERENGKGYPYGLRKNEIPEGAKIVSIADCFDAVTTDRPYQKSQSIASACNILRKGSGSYFCKPYVEAFIEEIEENGIIPSSEPNPLSDEEIIRYVAGDCDCIF